MKKNESKKPAAAKQEETPKIEKPATTEAKPESKLDNNTQSEVQPLTPQTPKTSSWRKHEERMLEKQQQERQRQLLRQQQQEAYGYTPFKAPPYPVYEQRSQTPREFGPAPNYGISRFETMPQEHGPPRPGTDMGMYKPARYQSYSTLPRPEQLEVESLYSGFRPPMNDVYGAVEKPELMNRPSSKMSRSYGMADPIKYRPGSAMSGRISENHFTVANIPYGPHFPVIQGTYVKEIVNWTGLNLCSYMQGASSVLSPSSALNPASEAEAISSILIVFVLFLVVFCSCGVGCCLFFIWKYRNKQNEKERRTYSPQMSTV